jgi:hypothetical protein
VTAAASTSHSGRSGRLAVSARRTPLAQIAALEHLRVADVVRDLAAQGADDLQAGHLAGFMRAGSSATTMPSDWSPMRSGLPQAA